MKMNECTRIVLAKTNVQDWGKKYMPKDVFLQLWYIYVTTNCIIIIISIK